MNEDKKLDVMEIADEELEGVTGGTFASERENGGFCTCPQCGGNISVTLSDCLYKNYLICPRCGLRIDIKSMKSGSERAIRAFECIEN